MIPLESSPDDWRRETLRTYVGSGGRFLGGVRSICIAVPL